MIFANLTGNSRFNNFNGLYLMEFKGNLMNFNRIMENGDIH